MARVIPDSVYHKRCRYCLHYQKQYLNNPVPEEQTFSRAGRMTPCRIFGIAEFSKTPGECLSFCPKVMFGICQYCKYHNSFDPQCCTKDNVNNRQQVYLGYGEKSKYEYSVCDCYRVSSTWKPYILRNYYTGEAPANFDPDTWKPLSSAELSIDRETTIAAINFTVLLYLKHGVKVRRTEFENNSVNWINDKISITLYYSKSFTRANAESCSDCKNVLFFNDCICILYDPKDG